MNPEQNTPQMQPTPPVTPMAPPPAPMPTSTPLPPQKRSNKVWIILTVIALIVALTAGGLWWWTASARSDFTKKASSYEQTVRSAYEYYRDNPNPTANTQAIADHFTSALNTKPATPTLLSWNLAADADKSKVNDLTNKLKTLRDSYNNYHNFKGFGDSVLKTMSSVTGTISTPADMQTKKTQFTKVINDLKAITVVPGSEDFMQKKINAYQTVVDDLTSALSAYDKKDSAGYTTAINKLAADIKGISTSTAANELTTMNTDYYNKLVKAYDDLGTLLKETN
jgi:hypothetical protein